MNHKNKTYNYGINFILKAMRVQLFLYLLSLPLFWYWGLPISMISPITNLICTPLLISFLLLSSLIFFTEIVTIPNQLLITLLEYITKCWLWISSQVNDSALFFFTKPALPYFIIIPLVTILLIKHYKLKTTVKSVTALCLFSGILLCTTAFHRPSEGIYRITHQTVALTSNAKTIVTIAAQKYISYNDIKNNLNQLLQHNIRTINVLIIKEVHLKNLCLALHILQSINVEHVYIINWHRKLSILTWDHWIQILDICNKKHVHLQKIDQPTLIYMQTTSTALAIYITPLYNKHTENLEVIGAYEDKLFTA